MTGGLLACHGVLKPMAKLLFSKGLLALAALFAVFSGCATGEPKIAHQFPPGTLDAQPAPAPPMPGMDSFGKAIEYRSSPVAADYVPGHAARAALPVELNCNIVDSFGESSACRYFELKLSRVMKSGEPQSISIRANEKGVFHLPREWIQPAIELRLASKSAQYRVVEGDRFPAREIPKQVKVERLER